MSSENRTLHRNSFGFRITHQAHIAIHVKFGLREQPIPLDLPANDPRTPLATTEAQDAYLEAAFASRHPVLIADAVNAVARARESSGIPPDDAWETTFELFHSVANTQHLLESIAEADAYRKAAGLTSIDGPSASE
jgi:hypothetical protein